MNTMMTMTVATRRMSKNNFNEEIAESTRSLRFSPKNDLAQKTCPLMREKRKRLV